MAKSKGKQSASSLKWHDGRGCRRKDKRVEKSSKGKFKTVAELEAHRQKQPHTKNPRYKDVAQCAIMDDQRLMNQMIRELEYVRLSTYHKSNAVKVKA